MRGALRKGDPSLFSPDLQNIIRRSETIKSELETIIERESSLSKAVERIAKRADRLA
jgi:hypothetical protein